jgi:xanthine dehydrogenase small subunit
MRRVVRFLLGHEPVALETVDPTLTVLEWLRRRAFRRGTKEGCAEGDCGACSVIVAEPENGRLRYRAVNACIRFMATLDGCQLLTVEDLKAPDGTLHPVQQAMVEHHGSQCGFCTPGFVMTLAALHHEEPGTPTRARIDDALAGNLCRCTGYGPIIAAARTMHATPGATAHLRDCEPAVLAQLQAWRDGATITVGEAGRSFLSPGSLDDLLRLAAEHPEGTILAGATDVGLWVTKQHRVLDPLIWLGRVPELQRIEETPDAIRIGAGVTYASAFARIAALWPTVGELNRRLGAEQIRHAGTIGGNIANGSPIGDSPPWLIAAGATLHLAHQDGRRNLPLEDYFLAYGKQDRRPGEIVEAVTVPKPGPTSEIHCYKISKRFDQDISAVAAGIRLDREGDRISAARIAFGGMAATPKRAAAAEAALTGEIFAEAAFRRAMAALAEDYQPIGDMRASATYRLKVAQNLLLKAYVESSTATPLRIAGRREPVHA